MGLVKRAKAGCVVVVEENGRDFRARKKKLSAEFFAEAQSSATGSYVGSVSAKSALSPKLAAKGTYLFLGRLLSNQSNLAAPWLAGTVRISISSSCCYSINQAEVVVTYPRLSRGFLNASSFRPIPAVYP
jgi:hypothetical protein